MKVSERLSGFSYDITIFTWFSFSYGTKGELNEKSVIKEFKHKQRENAKDRKTRWRETSFVGWWVSFSIFFIELLLWVILYFIHSHVNQFETFWWKFCNFFLLKCIRQEIKNFFDIDDGFFFGNNDLWYKLFCTVVVSDEAIKVLYKNWVVINLGMNKM